VKIEISPSLKHWPNLILKI